MRHFLMTTAAALAISAPGGAGAATFNYVANLIALNSSGVSGVARLSLDDQAKTLAVSVRAAGLEASQIHVQHIHGNFDANGDPADTRSPTIAEDADLDGLVELAEGGATYGPIILNLMDDTLSGLDGFPTAPNGMIDFSYVYDLTSTPAFAAGLGAADLGDLSLREIVIHGLSLQAGEGSGPGEADGTGGYKLVLPVASGEFSAVPIPAAGLLLLSGLGGLFLYGRRRS